MAKKIPCFFQRIIFFLLLTSIGQLHAINNDSLSKQIQAKSIKNVELYVSNTIIYISNKSTVSISGDLTFKNSAVLGSGKLVLKSNHKQNIHSTSSVINNLEIDNPTSVALFGDLAIIENLTIKKGIFDISEGILIINPENLHLSEGGSLFKGKQPEFSTAYPISTITTQSLLLQGNFTAHLKISPFGDFFYKKVTSSFKEIMYHNSTIISFFQPPKEV